MKLRSSFSKKKGTGVDMTVLEFRKLNPGDCIIDRLGHEAKVVYRKADYIYIKDQKGDSDYIYEIGCHKWKNVETRENTGSVEGS